MSIVRIMIPLPLRAELYVGKVVGGLRALMRRHAWIAWNRPGRRGLSRRRAVWIFADHGPIVIPAHRLQMNNPAVPSIGLKVNEPALAVRAFDIRSLMGSVDVGRALRKHHAMLIRAVNLARPQHRLRSRPNTANRRKDVIVAVALVHLGPFKQRQMLGILHDDLAFIEHGFS